MIIQYSKEITKPQNEFTVEFFQEVLENALRLTEVNLLKAKVTLGSAAGDNFCSLIYRVNLKYHLKKPNENGDLWVICKCILNTDATKFLEDLAVFHKEKICYYEVIPRMEMLLPPGQHLACRLFHTYKGSAQMLIFEDLSRKGYVMASRESGLDEAHCRLVLKRLGQFHATSLLLADIDPDILKCFNYGLLSKTALEAEDEKFLKYFEGNLEALLEEVYKWSGFENIYKKLQNYSSNLKENLWKSQAPLSGEFCVLNHGDLWVNNMLFKYNKDHKPIDVLFLDLQMSVWGSPGIDLNYFFYTSLKLDLLKNKRLDFLQEYYESLSANLLRLNYKNIPSFDKIQKEVAQRESYGFMANCFIYPIVAMDKKYSNDNNLDNLANEELGRKKRKQMFGSKVLKEQFHYTLKEFEANGVLK